MLRVIDIQKLLTCESGLAVSILMPVDRERPGNLEDPLRLESLVDEAIDRLRADRDPARVAAVTARLRSIATEVEFGHPSAGIALFVNEFESHAFGLPFAPTVRIEVGPRFVIRDLVEGVQDHFVGRVLVLSEHSCHLFVLDGWSLSEVLHGGFPIRADREGVERNQPHRDRPVHDKEHDEVRATFRAMDRALDAAGARDLPIVVAGVERDLSLFLEVSHHAAQVVGTIRGNHNRTPTRHLIELARSVFSNAAAVDRASTVNELLRELDAQRVAVDILDVWRAAHEGRGRLLLVDHGLELRGRVEPDHFELIEPDRLDLVANDTGDQQTRWEDAVESVIEAVLTHGGEVVFVEPGELPEPLHLALVLRWP